MLPAGCAPLSLLLGSRQAHAATGDTPPAGTAVTATLTPGSSGCAAVAAGPFLLRLQSRAGRGAIWRSYLPEVPPA